MLKISNNRILADKVLRLVKKKLTERAKGTRHSALYTSCSVTARIQSYQNGREQGHALFVSARKEIDAKILNFLWIGFAEARRSDHIVVFHDHLDPMQSVSETAYVNGHYFDTPAKAASHIIKLIDEMVKITAKNEKYIAKGE